MTPYYADDWLTVYHGDCREVMAGMEPESVHCVVTSSPFWGLRDYGVDGQLGLEPTPDEYVANLVAVFREVKRVLRADGTLWLNLGDSYANTGQSGLNNNNGGTSTLGPKQDGLGESNKAWTRTRPPQTVPFGLKPKDLVGIPWRVAFALQADGWYLRSDIIWSKPNPMPESVTDRPTKSHEYIFLLSKSPRYYFDADAVREPPSLATVDRWHGDPHPRRHNGGAQGLATGQSRGENSMGVPEAGRNIRSVWTMATQPYPGAHFATFPEQLPERCIKAGTSEKGVCPECGAPWERVVEREATTSDGRRRPSPISPKQQAVTLAHRTDGHGAPGNLTYATTTTGWHPSCAHALEPVPAVVLDPFAGSGTTGMVAQSLSRRAVLIDLSLDYLSQLMTRNADIPLGLGA